MASPKHESTQMFLDEFLDLEDRKLILVGDVDEDMLLRTLLAFDILEAQATKPITIVLSSSGGSVYEGFGIYDRIKESPCFVTIEAYGPLMSMATVIFQAADERLLSVNARFMTHYGSMESAGNTQDVIKHVNFVKGVDEPLVESIYLEKIRIKHKRFGRKQLEELLTTDTFFLPNKVVELGLADAIKFRTKRKMRKK